MRGLSAESGVKAFMLAAGWQTPPIPLVERQENGSTPLNSGLGTPTSGQPSYRRRGRYHWRPTGRYVGAAQAASRTDNEGAAEMTTPLEASLS